MALLIDLEPEEEEVLLRLAESRGITPEAYVQALIMELIRSGGREHKSGLVARLRRAVSEFRRSNPYGDLTDDGLRGMRVRVAEHKERVVEAIARAEMLNRIRDRQQKLTAEKELQALSHARAGNTQKALLRFQESCVFGEIVRALHTKYMEASEQADQMLSVFREEERKVKRILSSAQSVALEEVQRAGGAYLPAPEMEKRIAELGNPDEWQKRYESWIRSHLDATGSYDDTTVAFVAPEFSAKELSELELELMCGELEGRSAEAEE